VRAGQPQVLPRLRVRGRQEAQLRAQAEA